MMPLCWAAAGRGEGGGAGQTPVVRPGWSGPGAREWVVGWRAADGGQGVVERGGEWDSSRLLNYLLFLSDNN